MSPCLRRCTGRGEALHCSVHCHHGFSITVRSRKAAPPHQVFYWSASSQTQANVIWSKSSLKLFYMIICKKSCWMQRNIVGAIFQVGQSCMQSTYMTDKTYMFDTAFQYKSYIMQTLSRYFSQYILFSVFPQRQTNLECLHGSWDRIVSCQPTDCGFPDQSYVYHGLFSCPSGTTFGKQCSFTCEPPSILQG